ncbi:hypothetical protein ACPV5S_15665 [Vibrio astriarenae]
MQQNTKTVVHRVSPEIDPSVKQDVKRVNPQGRDVEVPRVPTGLKIEATGSTLFARWTRPESAGYSHTEVYAHTTAMNDGQPTEPPPASPSRHQHLVGVGGGLGITIPAEHGVGYYVWARHFNRDGQGGPIAGPVHIVGKVSLNYTLPAAVSYHNLDDDMQQRLDSAGERPKDITYDELHSDLQQRIDAPPANITMEQLHQVVRDQINAALTSGNVGFNDLTKELQDMITGES